MVISIYSLSPRLFKASRGRTVLDLSNFAPFKLFVARYATKPIRLGCSLTIIVYRHESARESNNSWSLDVFVVNGVV